MRNNLHIIPGNECPTSRMEQISVGRILFNQIGMQLFGLKFFFSSESIEDFNIQPLNFPRRTNEKRILTNNIIFSSCFRPTDHNN